MNSNLSRDEAADIFKGILIICVLYAHSLSKINSIRGATWDGSPVNVFFTSFNMPAFALISGYFVFGSLCRNGSLRVAKTRIIRLVPLLIVWSILPLIIESLINNTFQISMVIQSLYTLPFHGGKLWYIVSYLLCSLIACAFFISERGFFHKRQWMHIAIQTVFLVSLLIAVLTSKVSFAHTTYLLPFFMLGYYINKLSLLEKKSFKKLLVILSVFFPLLLFFYKPDISFYSYSQCMLFYVSDKRDLIRHFIILLYRFILAISGICFFYHFAKMLKGLDKNNRVYKILLQIGKNTLSIYILSMFIQELLLLVFRQIHFEKYLNDMNIIFSIGPIFFFALLFSSHYLSKCIEKIPIVSLILLGKSNR